MKNQTVRKERYNRLSTACEPFRKAKAETLLTKCLALAMAAVLVFTSSDVTAFASTAKEDETNKDIITAFSELDESVAEQELSVGAAELPEHLKALKERINALPAGEEYRAMTADEQDAVYEEAAEISDACLDFTDEELAAIGFEKLEELFIVMNGDVALLESTNTHTCSEITFTPGVGQGVLRSGNYYLVHDETVVQNSSGIVVSGSAVTVNICLNGHTLNLNGTQIWLNNGATVNIYDCTGEGKIAGGVGKQHGKSTDPKGGAFYVRGSTLNIYGGTIEGNEAQWGGAIFIDGSDGTSTVNMYGGTIRGNTAEKGGGGIEVENTGSVFNMYGGSIVNNTVTNLNGNVHKGGGVHFAAGTMTIQGKVNIIGNTVAGAGNNVYLRKGNTISVAGKIDEGSRIGVSAYAVEYSGTDTVVTNGYSDKSGFSEIKCFFMDRMHDSTKYALVFNSTSPTDLYIKRQTHTWEYGAKDNLMYAYCVNPLHMCAFHQAAEPKLNTLTLTLDAKDAVYSGNPYDKVSYGEEEETIWKYAGLNLPTIMYEGKDFKDTAYESSATAPANVGSYQASIGSGDNTVTAVDTFKISPKPLTDAVITLSPGETIYTGSPITQSISEVKLDTVLLTTEDYEKDENTAWTGTEPGDYTVKINGKGNYTETASAVWKIVRKKMSGVFASPVIEDYDGENHPITVSGIPDDAGTVKTWYSLDGENYSETVPDCKDVKLDADGKAASYTVYYKVTSDNYEDYKAATTVTVNPREVTVSGIMAAHKEYDGTTAAALHCENAVITGKIATDELTVTAAGAFADKDAAASKKVTISSLSLAGSSAGNYKLADSGHQTETAADITPRPVTLAWSGETAKTYTGNSQSITAQVSNQAVDADTFTLTYEGNEGTDVQNYTAKVTGLGNSNYTLTGAANVTQDWSIRYLDADVTVSGTLGNDDWYMSDVTLTPATTGYQISTDGTEWQDSLVISTEGENTVTYYLKQVSTSYLTEQKSKVIKIDKTAPGGTVSISTDSWRDFLNRAAFGWFFKETQEVTVTAQDTEGGSGIDQVSYYKSATPISDTSGLADVSWESASDNKFHIEKNEKGYVYVKIVDKAGNAYYISTDGIVVYTDAAQVTKEITFAKKSLQNVDAVAALNGNTIKEVRNGDSVLTKGTDYTISSDGTTITFVASYLQSLDVNDYTIYVSYNPGGETYVEKEGNVPPVETTIKLTIVDHIWDNGTITQQPDCTGGGRKKYTCTVCGAEKEEAMEALGHDFAEEFTVDKEAACTEAGSKSKHCSRCQEVTDVTEIPALGHDWSGDWTVIKEASATENGKKEKICAREGCNQKKYEVIPRIGTTDEGTMEKNAEVAMDAPVEEATLDNKKEELLNADKIFTPAEKEAIEGGTSARVWLEITRTDEGSIPAEDKTKIEEEAKNIMGDKPAITYFDADLFKQIAGKTKKQLYEPGIDIKVTIRIPSDLLNQDRTRFREYKIIRYHIDAATGTSQVAVLEGTFDETTGDFSFETDKFSTYAIAYRDTEINLVMQQKEAVLTKAGENVQLTAAVEPAEAGNQKVKWTTSDPKVATVDDTGKVTAVGNGICTITAATEDGGKTASCKVTVKIADTSTQNPSGNGSTGTSSTLKRVTGVLLTPDAITLTKAGETQKLVAEISPKDAWNQKVTWKSSDETVAMVDKDGNVTAVGNGSAVITAITEDGGYRAAVTVTVAIPEAEQEPEEETGPGQTTDTEDAQNPSDTENPSDAESSPDSETDEETSTTAIRMSKVMGTNQKFRITLANSTGAKVVCSTSDKTIAAIKKTGMVQTGSKTGKATLTITMTKGSHQLCYIVRLTVKKEVEKNYSLKKSESYGKTPSILLYKRLEKGASWQIDLLHAENSEVAFVSKNKKIATVSKKGVVKAKKAGKAVIRVKATTNGVTDSYYVVVRCTDGKKASDTSYLTVCK